MGLLQATCCLRRPNEFCLAGVLNARHGDSTPSDTKNVIVDDPRCNKLLRPDYSKQLSFISARFNHYFQSKQNGVYFWTTATDHGAYTSSHIHSWSVVLNRLSGISHILPTLPAPPAKVSRAKVGRGHLLVRPLFKILYLH